MGFSVGTAVVLLSFISSSFGAFPPIPVAPPAPPPAQLVTAALVNAATFTQLIDHEIPETGTFSQRYWWSTEFWKGPGSPVVLMTPGEIDAAGYTGYLSNRTLTGLFAQTIGGAVIVIEHRYWGESSPYENLTTDKLHYLTLRQSISDLTNFAQTVDLPFDTSNTSNSDFPWIFSGGSYSGALAAWMETTSPGTFWAYHASSAPVEAVYDYWQYFAPVQQGMPRNCSKDVSLVIDYVDEVLINGSEANKTSLKTLFGLEAVEHDDDFASALENGPWLWQSNSFYTGYSGFYQFCDAVENVTLGSSQVPDANGVGLETALAGYANWVNSSLIPGYCSNYGFEGEYNLDCFNTYDPKSIMYTDISVGNSFNRQWMWFLCNEPLAYWQDGAPKSSPTIVSRLVTASYWQRQCELYFPKTNHRAYGSSPDHHPPYTVDHPNSWTKGWDTPKKATPSTRVMWANGEFDPWKTSGISSEYRTGGPWQSTENAPVQVIPGGFHCSDLILKNGLSNAGVQKVIDAEVALMKTWVAEFYTEKLKV